jgi:hypothetical protein
MEKIYTNGLYAKPPRTEKQAEFIVASLSIKPKEFVEFINENKDKCDKGGYLNVEIKKSMKDTGRYYGQVNLPYNSTQTNPVTAKDHSPDRDSDLPF